MIHQVLLQFRWNSNKRKIFYKISEKISGVLFFLLFEDYVLFLQGKRVPSLEKVAKNRYIT